MADTEADYMIDRKNDNEDIEAEQSDHPKREHLLQWMEITVCEPEKRTGGPSMKMQDAYTVYLVESKVIDEKMPGFNEAPTSLWRRYTEFELLKNYLDVMYPAYVIPPLPEKRTSHAWSKLATDRFDAEFIERRRVGLENFLLRVASHTVLSQDKMFHAFLKQDDGWKESVHATDFYSKADSKLKTMSASYRLKKPDKRFEELKAYSGDFQTHINNILKIRVRLCENCFGIYKVHQNYSRVFNEWGAQEKDMVSGLVTAGQYMEVYAKSIDSQLEDEEQFAEQLKEYYYFGDSLRWSSDHQQQVSHSGKLKKLVAFVPSKAASSDDFSLVTSSTKRINVVRKQELLQLDVEKAEENLCTKCAQRDQLAQGKVSGLSFSGIKTRLFGNDTPEQREQKLKQLDQDIEDAEEKVTTTTEELEKFIEVALRDLDRYNRQKVKDLKDIFTNYAILQIDRCKKGITLWQNTKDSFAKM